MLHIFSSVAATLLIHSRSFLSPYTWELPLKCLYSGHSGWKMLSFQLLFYGEGKGRNWESDPDCKPGVVPLWLFFLKRNMVTLCATLGYVLSWCNLHFSMRSGHFLGMWYVMSCFKTVIYTEHWQWFLLNTFECISCRSNRRK